MKTKKRFVQLLNWVEWDEEDIHEVMGIRAYMATCT